MDWARKLISMALKEGAEEAEVYGMDGRSVDIDLRKGSVELASESFHCGLGLRAVVKGAVGFSSTSNMKLLERVAHSATRSARARGVDKSWCSLPHPEKVKRPEGIFDPALENISPEECLDLAVSMLQGCEKVKGAEPISGGVTCISGTDFVVNSNGIELKERATLMQGSMETIAKRGDVATGSEFQNSRTLLPTLESVGEAAAEMAVASLGGTKGESGTFEVILRPLAFADLIQSTILPALYADNVQKGRSFLKGRIGEMIFNENLEVSDDGLLPDGMNSSAFDGEGVPSRRNELIEKGVLKGFLYDSYTGGKVGVKSTGNAIRSGYSDLPRIGIRNLLVSSPYSYDPQADTNGYLVNSLIGAHTANPISGDFSVEAKNCFYVKSGETVKPIRSLMIAGNIFELLKDVEVGIDVRILGSIVTPSVKVKMKVVGS